MEELRSLPKALLHDHLDGGLRVDTILELATAVGYEGLPANDEAGLREWFHQGESGSLERYLESFDHTLAVMQTAEALERVGYEAVVDVAADGVVYAELRFAPAFNTDGGLTLEEVVAAVARGVQTASSETDCVTGLILDGMRQMKDSEEIADLAVASRDLGVIGFDLAGPEAGYPNDDHAPACLRAREANLPVTVHAGEGDGVHQIWRALHHCGALRIGHGVRIIEDTTVINGEITDTGPVASFVRDVQVPLEVSVSSNIHTGIFPTVAQHPIGMLHRAGFAVTLNTDNRLMSGTSMTTEFALVAEHHGFGIGDFHAVTRRAILAGFTPWPRRQELLEKVDEIYLDLY